MHQENATTQPHKMMSPLTALKTCFKQYFDFKGRATRAEFWWFFAIFYSLMFCIAFVVQAVDDNISILSVGFQITFGGLFLLLPVVFVVGIAVAVRRLHDTNRSGWWLLLPALLSILGGSIDAVADLFELIGIIPLITFWCIKGQSEANRFGAPGLVK